MLDKADYWLELCDDDLKAARAMLDSNNFLWMAFICHLIAEKALKAVIAGVTSEVPPKTHNLNKLAEIGDILNDMSESQQDLLEELTPLNIEARYPEYKEKIKALLSLEYCTNLLAKTEEFLCWIKLKLGK